MCRGAAAGGRHGGSARLVRMRPMAGRMGMPHAMGARGSPPVPHAGRAGSSFIGFATGVLSVDCSRGRCGVTKSGPSVASRVRRLGRVSRPVLSSRLDPDSEQKPFITRSAAAPLPHYTRGPDTRDARHHPHDPRGGSAPDAQQGATSNGRAARGAAPPRAPPAAAAARPARVVR